MVPLQAGFLGFLITLVGIVVWLAVVWAIFDIRTQTERTAEATERVAAALDAETAANVAGNGPNDGDADVSGSDVADSDDDREP